MKKAKRFVSLLLVAVMTLYLLAGCGDVRCSACAFFAEITREIGEKI